jgi:tRNA A-37 threonylcarbamoyl transferase component Bud32
MSSLKELQEGKLKGIKRLTLSENLTTFPEEIFTLAESLEILDLSNNNLCSLPDDLHQLKKLKIAFFSNNNFTEVPTVFKKCENLYMLGFKANKIVTFDEDILPLSISWLILTDNKIEKLPNSIGDLTKLQKFAMAGNQLKTLPQNMSSCVNLELIRLSANNLEALPEWLLTLPKLSWLAFSGNPFCNDSQQNMREMSFKDLEVKELLGEGASGEIYKAYSKTFESDVAVKLFKGDVTSDGYAKDEMDVYMATGEHTNLIKVLAKIDEPNRLGLLLELIPKSYKNLGFPPNFDTCTRDTFSEDCTFSVETIQKVGQDILAASIHLHEKNLMHGDLYAHNILINEKNHSYLGDFGAASFYNSDSLNCEKIEVRAFGCLLDDMLQRCDNKSCKMYHDINVIAQNCMQSDVEKRKLFSEIKI